MAEDILGMYGNDSSTPQKERASEGGVTSAKPLPYSPPTGRAGSTNGPGLGGTNHGTCGTQGRH